MKKRLVIIVCLILVLILPACTGDYDINQLYAVTYNGDFTFDYAVRDKNGNILISDEGVPREPEVKVINQSLLSLSVQTGTGISTRWTVYCDVHSGRISETYYSVLGEYRNNAVFVNYNSGRHSVVIQDIFDKEVFFREIILEDASQAADPVVAFEELEEGIKIVYLKGSDYSETELTIEIDSGS